MRVLLLKLALIPHRIWAALFAAATAIDKAWLWLRPKLRRKPPVYGWKGDPRGGNYHDPDDVVTSGGGSIFVSQRTDLPGRPWQIMPADWMAGVVYVPDYPSIELQERVRFGKVPLERYRVDKELKDILTKHKPEQWAEYQARWGDA